MILYATQKITNRDKISVNKVLNSKFLTRGPITKKFESKISKLCKVKYSLSINSASSGLHLACLAIGLKKKKIKSGLQQIHTQQRLMPLYIAVVQ